jgi:phosphatidylglycerol:prolipoprotein diacylglycerol transferase
MLTIAFLAGTILAVSRTRKLGMPPFEMVNVANLIIISSIVGSRLLFVFEEPGHFLQYPMSIFSVWRGGVSYHGALLLSAIAVFSWLRIRRLSEAVVFDSVAPALVLGFLFVRLGCFLNGCCFGTPTGMPWGVIFPFDSPAGQTYPSLKLHPTQLYEAAAALASVFIILALERKGVFRARPFSTFFCALILSSLWRFIVEFYRHQETPGVFAPWCTTAQVYCLILLTLSISGIAIVGSKKPMPVFR